VPTYIPPSIENEAMCPVTFSAHNPYFSWPPVANEDLKSTVSEVKSLGTHFRFHTWLYDEILYVLA
jgi:hypothetical protein